MRIPWTPLVLLMVMGGASLPLPTHAQTARGSDRPTRTLSRSVDGVAGLRTLHARSADELFQRLPQALELRDSRGLQRLLAPAEVSVGLEGPDQVQVVSPDQAFYLIDEHFAALAHDTSRRLALDGYASSTRRIVCVPGDSPDPARSQAVLHMMLATADGPLHARIHVEARRFDRGWRVTALRSLD